MWAAAAQGWGAVLFLSYIEGSEGLKKSMSLPKHAKVVSHTGLLNPDHQSH